MVCLFLYFISNIYYMATTTSVTFAKFFTKQKENLFIFKYLTKQLVRILGLDFIASFYKVAF